MQIWQIFFILIWTKTEKTPFKTLKLLQSICVKRYDSVFKSELLSLSHTARHNHFGGSSPQKEKPAAFIQSLKY